MSRATNLQGHARQGENDGFVCPRYFSELVVENKSSGRNAKVERRKNGTSAYYGSCQIVTQKFSSLTRPFFLEIPDFHSSISIR